MKKRYLFLQTRSPLEGGPEAFDLALTAAAFDHEVHLVLAEDGVFWLRAGLPDMVRETIDQINWESESMTERGLSVPEMISRADLAGLIAESDVVVSG